jgi:hypothetical protein
VVLFTPSIPFAELLPTGYVFNLGNVPEHDAFTLLAWLAENDWDYQTNGPAKIGGAGWKDSYNVEFQNAMKAYAKTHPKQFDYIGGFTTDFAFLWQTEIEALKDADYIFPPSVPTSFMTQYRKAGYDAKFICADTQSAFTDLIDDASLWDEINGAIFVVSSRWWNDPGPIVDFTKGILNEKHSPETAEKIQRKGSGYLSLGTSLNSMLSIIRNAVEVVGPEALDSQAIYDSAEAYSIEINGLKLYSFNSEKRYLCNYKRIYIADEDEQNLILASDGWIPVVTEP